MIGFGYIFKKFKTFLEINKNIQIDVFLNFSRIWTDSYYY